MKGTGPIPPAFTGPRLILAGRPAADLTAEHGTPLFAYDATLVTARVAAFRRHFPGIDLHYAIKANPFAPLLHCLAGQVDGLDIASSGELARAVAVMPPERISFAGPGKRDAELEAAIEAGITLNLESEAEAARALAIAQRLGRTPHLAVRVNPDFELRGSGMRMGGRPSPFGIDAARVPALVRRLIDEGADWRGLHVYAGSQALDAAAVIDMQAATLQLAERLCDEAGAAPPLLNLGGGFGVPYFAGDRPLDIAAVGAALAEATATRPPVLEQTKFAIELGRWLVAEVGVYLTRIVDRKESGGETFLVVDGGLHHQLAATGNLGTVVRRTYPIALADRLDGEPEETVSIVGPLCTPLDRLADRIGFPRAEPGDLVAVFLAGAYGLTASPTAFLGHPQPAEILVSAAPG